MSLKCDVLVIGAGPAGSMAAKTTSEFGYDTLLIERNEVIGSKVKCAEGVNFLIFQDTGIKKSDSFINREMDGTNIFFYNEIYKLTTYQWKGYVIDRKIFDKYLAEQAYLSGAKIMTDTEAVSMRSEDVKKVVTVYSLKENKNIEAKIVIGADGVNSKVSKWSGLNSYKKESLSKCFQYEVEKINVEEDKYFHIAFAEEFPMGFGWVFPKGKNRANVGVGGNGTFYNKTQLKFLISEYPYIKEMFLNNYSFLEKKDGIIPICGPKPLEQVVSNGVILVGDAAGMVEPITGEGIVPAMLSGVAAGETASIALKQNDWSKNKLSIYEKTWKNKTYLGNRTLGAMMDKMVNLRIFFYYAFTHRRVPKQIREKLLEILEKEEA